MQALWERLDGYWRDGAGKKDVNIFAFSTRRNEGFEAYRRDSWTHKDEVGSKKATSETGYFKDGKLALVTSDLHSEVLQCSSPVWSARSEQGGIVCKNSDASTIREFVVKAFTMEVHSTTNGVTENLVLDKDNVSWKKL